MTRRIRVLVVDDSAVTRRLVSDALASDPDLEVVGSAGNGRIALDKLAKLEPPPDIVTMDVEMPVMNGLEALREMRRTHPAIAVIMFSTLTERGAAATFEALALGARDYVTKPRGSGGASAAQQQIRDDLVPRIKALCHRLLGGAPTLAATPAAEPKLRAPRPTVAPDGYQRIDVVAIGASTGGPNALSAILTRLPADFPVPVLVVQHMPPLFTRLLAERLRGLSALDVREGVEGGEVSAERVWIAPGDHHMVVRRGHGASRLALNQEPLESGCRPAVDPLFRSVAAAYGPRALAVVLTGMGQDGLRGAEALVGQGSSVLAQDRATSIVWGMPGFVAQAGLAERVLALDDFPAEIVRRAQAGRSRGAESSPPTSRKRH